MVKIFEEQCVQTDENELPDDYKEFQEKKDNFLQLNFSLIIDYCTNDKIYIIITLRYKNICPCFLKLFLYNLFVVEDCSCILIFFCR